MVISCVAIGCTNRQESSHQTLDKNNIPISFHRFPDQNKKKALHDQWVKSVRRMNWTPTSFSFICSAHFKISDYKNPPGGERKPRLKPGVLPSQFEGFPSHLQKVVKKRKTVNSASTSVLSHSGPSSQRCMFINVPPASPPPPSVSPTPLEKERIKNSNLKKK